MSGICILYYSILFYNNSLQHLQSPKLQLGASKWPTGYWKVSLPLGVGRSHKVNPNTPSMRIVDEGENKRKKEKKNIENYVVYSGH